MNKQNNTISVNVLNKTFAVNCPAGQAAELQQCSKQLNEELRKISKQNNTAEYDYIVTVAALNLIHAATNNSQVTQQINDLEQRLAQTLTQTEQMEFIEH